MPCLILKYNSANDENPLPLRLSTDMLAVETMTLTGYSVHIKKVALVSPATAHKIPRNIFVTLDFLNCSDLNIGLPSYGVSSDGVPLYHLISKIPLPLSNEDYTITTGLNLGFSVCKHIPRDISIKVEHYDNGSNLIDAVRTPTGAGDVAIEDVVLFFDIKKSERNKGLIQKNFNL